MAQDVHQVLALHYVSRFRHLRLQVVMHQLKLHYLVDFHDLLLVQHHDVLQCLRMCLVLNLPHEHHRQYELTDIVGDTNVDTSDDEEPSTVTFVRSAKLSSFNVTESDLTSLR